MSDCLTNKEIDKLLKPLDKDEIERKKAWILNEIKNLKITSTGFIGGLMGLDAIINVIKVIKDGQDRKAKKTKRGKK